jgi:predicted dehydrogenase
MRPKIAVVGLNHGYSLARSIRASNSLELAALCTRNPANHQSKADALGVPLYGDLDSMLAEIDLSGVAVATSTDQLVPVTRRCLEHDLNILIEKPAGRDASEVLQLKQAAARSTGQVVVGYYRRLARQVITLGELLASNIIGDVVSVSCNWVVQKPRGYFQGWKASSATGGGCLMINVIHDLDLLQNLLGPIETVAALGARSSSGDDLEHATALGLRFKAGQVATVLFGDQSPSPYSYDTAVAAVSKFPTYPTDSHYFFGTRGSLAFPSFTVYTSPSAEQSWFDLLDCGVASRVNDAVDDPIAAQTERFAQVLRGQTAPHATLDDAIRNLLVVEAIRRSIARASLESVQAPSSLRPFD